MEYILNLTRSELEEFTSILKKAKLIGSSLLWVNDLLLPHNKNKKVKGETYIANPFDDLCDQNVVLITEDIDSVLKQLDSIRGRKTLIQYRRTAEYITIIVNDIEILVAVTHHDDDELVNLNSKFEDFTEGEDWIDFDNQFFADLRDNKLIIIDGPDKLHVRLTKSVIPSIGVQQKKWTIKYSGKYKITSGNRPKLYKLHIHMTFPFVDIVHKYTIVSYR